MLAESARRNIEEGAASPRAARDAGVKIALGSYVSLGATAEIQLMIRHGLTFAAAASTATQALDLAGHIGAVAETRQGRRPTDYDGDPLEEPRLLTDPSRIWLILQLGAPVADQALERDIGETANEPVTG